MEITKLSSRHWSCSRGGKSEKMYMHSPIWHRLELNFGHSNIQSTDISKFPSSLELVIAHAAASRALSTTYTYSYTKMPPAPRDAPLFNYQGFVCKAINPRDLLTVRFLSFWLYSSNLPRGRLRWSVTEAIRMNYWVEVANTALH